MGFYREWFVCDTVSSAVFQSLKRQSEYRWQEINRIGADPALQITSFGFETIDLDGVIYQHFKGGIRQVSLIRVKADLFSSYF